MRQYNPNKPTEYKVSCHSLSDIRVTYTYNCLPYYCTPKEIAEDGFYVADTKCLVDGMEKSTNLQGRSISIDMFFTSMTIAKLIYFGEKKYCCC